MICFFTRLLFIILLAGCWLAQADEISVSKACFGSSEEIIVSFEKDTDDNFDFNWIGIYFADEIEDVNSLREGEIWSFLCGFSCNPATNPPAGTISFSSNSPTWRQAWPLLQGTYRAVLSRGEDSEPWPLLAVSETFEVGECTSGEEVTTTPAPVPAPTVPVSSPESSSLPITVGPEMGETISDARQDIERLIESSELLSGKFLRLAFHDCVTVCDGCIDMTNPDNAGLVMAVEALEDVVGEYESRGLSRTDVWMLAAVVASDVTETRLNIDFPFQWIGRKTCEDMHSNNDCGIGANGQPSPCHPFAGPHRPLCHGDIDGTRTIQDFMSREFGFDAQQTAAIMGAHTIGAMRDVNLGFDGRRGWDLTNNNLDQGYFAELLGNANIDAPDWRQNFHRNDDLDGIPDRWQFEASHNGVDVTMLNSDMAMILDLVEGQNLMSDGRVTCDFSGSNACSRDTPFFPFMQRYAESRSDFLNDYRDALEMMINNGYAKDGTCNAGEVCALRSLR